MKLDDYLLDSQKPLAEYPYASLAEEFALLRAMAAGVKELEMTPEQFVTCMRYAINADLYKQVDDVPTILAMKIKIV